VGAEVVAAGKLGAELDAVDAIAVAAVAVTAVVLAGAVAVATGTEELPADVNEAYVSRLTMRRRPRPSRKLTLTLFPPHLTASSTTGPWTTLRTAR